MNNIDFTTKMGRDNSEHNTSFTVDSLFPVEGSLRQLAVSGRAHTYQLAAHSLPSSCRARFGPAGSYHQERQMSDCGGVSLDLLREGFGDIDTSFQWKHVLLRDRTTRNSCRPARSRKRQKCLR